MQTLFLLRITVMVMHPTSEANTVDVVLLIENLECVHPVIKVVNGIAVVVSMDSVRSEWQLLVKCLCNSSSERCESVLRRIVFLNLHLSNLSTTRRVPYFIDMLSLNHFLYHNRLKGLV